MTVIERLLSLPLLSLGGLRITLAAPASDRTSNHQTLSASPSLSRSHDYLLITIYFREFPCDYIASDVFVRKRDWYKLGVYIKVQAKW